jgi:hypothetical protein
VHLVVEREGCGWFGSGGAAQALEGRGAGAWALRVVRVTLAARTALRRAGEVLHLMSAYLQGGESGCGVPIKRIPQGGEVD